MRAAFSLLPRLRNKRTPAKIIVIACSGERVARHRLNLTYVREHARPKCAPVSILMRRVNLALARLLIRILAFNSPLLLVLLHAPLRRQRSHCASFYFFIAIAVLLRRFHYV